MWYNWLLPFVRLTDSSFQSKVFSFVIYSFIKLRSDLKNTDITKKKMKHKKPCLKHENKNRSANKTLALNVRFFSLIIDPAKIFKISLSFVVLKLTQLNVSLKFWATQICAIQKKPIGDHLPRLFQKDSFEKDLIQLTTTLRSPDSFQFCWPWKSFAGLTKYVSLFLT